MARHSVVLQPGRKTVPCWEWLDIQWFCSQAWRRSTVLRMVEPGTQHWAEHQTFSVRLSDIAACARETQRGLCLQWLAGMLLKELSYMGFISVWMTRVLFMCGCSQVPVNQSQYSGITIWYNTIMLYWSLKRKFSCLQSNLKHWRIIEQVNKN